MGLTTYYFAPTSQGLGDGSSAANAAALFSGGAWSTLITGFNFTAGTNGLEARILPGTYTITATLASASFTSGAPSPSAPLFVVGSDSSGNALSPVTLGIAGWTADQPAFSTSAFPVLTVNSTISIINVGNVYSRCISFTSSSCGGVLTNCHLDWCSVINSTSNTSAVAISTNATRITNCVLQCTGSSYNVVVSGSTAGFFDNVSISGATGTSGTRAGLNINSSSADTFAISRVCITGVGGIGLMLETSSSALAGLVSRCVIANCGSDGIALKSSTVPSSIFIIVECCITGNGGYGVNNIAGGAFYLANSRIDRNTSGSGSTTWGNWATYDLYTTAGSDAADYNNAAGGDYRINASAGFANRNIGVSQMGSGGSGGIKRVNFDGGF